MAKTKSTKNTKKVASGQAKKAGVITARARETLFKEFNIQYSRMKTLNTYINRLEDADKKVTDFIQNVIDETTRTYHSTIWFFWISYVVGLTLLIGGLVLGVISSNITTTQTFNFLPLAITCIVLGIIDLIFLQTRNPVKNLRYMVDNLVKLNMIFVGYIRQVHQVDAIFEDLFSSGKDIAPQVAEQMLSYLQDATAEAMTAISHVSSDLGE